MLCSARHSCHATLDFDLIKPWHWAPAALVLILGAGFAVGETMGWHFLAGPLQRQLQHKLGRDVRLSAATDNGPGLVSLNFWGGIRLQSRVLEIGAPAWSRAPYFLLAQDVDLHLRYSDVWRVWQGQQLLVQSLAARHLTVYLERTADGQASWLMAKGGAAPKPPRIQNIDLPAGTVHYTDVPLALNFDAQLSLSSPARSASPPPGAAKPRVAQQCPGSLPAKRLPNHLAIDGCIALGSGERTGHSSGCQAGCHPGASEPEF